MGAEKAVLNERADYFSNARSEMLPFVPRTAKRILGAGCGDGVFGARLKEDLGAEVWGIETDREAGEAAEAQRRASDRERAGATWSSANARGRGSSARRVGGDGTSGASSWA